MNRKIYLTLFVVALAVFSTLLSGCDFSKVKIGEVRMMYGENDDGHIAYTFSAFSGFERGSALAEAGQTIAFDYQASIDEGSLIIEWQTPDGEILWHTTVVESNQGTEIFPVESPGEHKLVIQGIGAEGDFVVSWEVK